MKSDLYVADHIRNVELMASQLISLGEYMFNQAIMTKILSMLLSSYKHLVSIWDSIPIEQQIIKYLIVQLLKEESRNQ